MIDADDRRVVSGVALIMALFSGIVLAGAVTLAVAVRIFQFVIGV